MTSSSALDAGRAAAADRRWAAAYEELARADSAGDLDTADLELLATAAFLRGEAGAAAGALTRAHGVALASGDVEGAARTAAWLAIFQFELGDLSHNLEWLPRGLRLANMISEPSAVSGLVQLAPAVAQLAGGDPLGARARFEEVLAIAERFHDRDLWALASFGRGKSLIEVGDDTRGFACQDDTVTAVLGGEVSSVAAGLILCTIVGDAHIGFDLTRVVAWTRVLDEWCRAQPELVAFSGERHALRAALLTLRGAWAEASAAAELALAGFRAGDYRAAFGAPYWFAELQRLRGAFHSAADGYRRAGETSWEPQPGLALLHLAEGKVELAREEIRRSASAADPFTRRYLLPAVVEIEVAAGDPGDARRALDELRTLGAPVATRMFAALVAFAEGQVLLAEGDPRSALASSRDALKAWRALGVPYEAARSRVLVGRALQFLGDAAAARSEFDAARVTFLELGAQPALAELEEVTGERRAGSLTAREVEVLRLVSTGLTNRAIGARLSLSEKTVARHLSNIFGKLGLSSRAAATAYAYENGLV
ncbi:response regulator transcription factor [Agromyces sp. NPDC049794]|uniref:helix-turn-helix transcriptional regulator n=1 Tax=unclassified Agromyces TaxID=2639701 RepID=UPI0033EEECEB